MTRNPMDLKERTILVTGASSGIGRETSLLLSQLGARLILVARSKERLKETHEHLEGSGHFIQPFDLTAIDDIPSWLKGITAEVGALDGLVHCAGIHMMLPIRLLHSQQTEEVMRINFSSAIGLAKAFRQKGVSNSGSSLVLLSSVMGLVGESGVVAYAASKGALIAMTKSLAMELAREKIRVNCVAPGYVKTEMVQTQQQLLTSEQFSAIEAMHPLGIGTPLDIAYSIAFLLADTGRWITGTTLIVDGGYTAH